MLEHVGHGVDDLAQVVRGDVRRHPDSDALRSVHEQVRKARGQHDRLLGRPVVVGDEVDGVLVDPGEELERELARRHSV
jgi:hypothetical protein